MRGIWVVTAVAIGVVILGLAPVSFGIRERVRQVQPSSHLLGDALPSEPFVIVQEGVPTWVVPEQTRSFVGAAWVLPHYWNDTYCSGDPLGGHGGEATGGPGGFATWCVERGVGDSCGTRPPWDTSCFEYVDVRALASQMNINYWHIDSYRTGQRLYTGTRALWCGADTIWHELPVECGTWINPPGYGNQWDCIVQLRLPDAFSVANGCTLYFDPRYDTECQYDFLYVDYWNGSNWVTLATFNGTSNDPGPACGDPAKPNLDYFLNTDVNRLPNCDWQGRFPFDVPAFRGKISHVMLGTVVQGPRFRWRFVSDAAWSDADGMGDTDGAAFIDNVWVKGDLGSSYTQDFETCSVFGALPQYWSLGNPAPVAQGWHIKHDSDPPYEGNEAGVVRTTCLLDSSWTWRARPENGFPPGSPQRYGSYYRLLSPRVAIQNTGCVVQYDQFMCTRGYTCDYTDTKVRFHDVLSHRWCPWINIDGYILSGGCTFWNLDYTEEVSGLYGAGADSVRFGWDLIDVSVPGDPCRGKHKDTDDLIDNVSIGFFAQTSTMFAARGPDLLQDSFLPGVSQAFNSFFDAYDPDTIARYSGNEPATLPKDQQLCVSCRDKDGLAEVKVFGSDDGGATWASRSMTLSVPNDPYHPDLGGEYYGTLKAGDFSPGDTVWEAGTEVWYYVKATDLGSQVTYFPATADSGNAGHTGGRDDYLEFSILPMYPPEYTGVKILLVDGHDRDVYDWSSCLSRLDNSMPLEDIYRQTLVDAGYSFDKYDIGGAGGSVQIDPIWMYDYYDAVVWFTGPRFAAHLFDKEAQEAIRTYLAGGGNVVLCGDRIAYAMAQAGGNEDLLDGDFLGGIMGCTYQEEMEGPFEKPFVYMDAADTVSVFGTPVDIDLGPLVIYREYPYLKEMSYVLTDTIPLPVGYTAQQILRVTNPGLVANADGAIYVEYQDTGQCVFVNFDMCAMVNHWATSCTGVTPDPAPDFNPGYYYGRVDLMRAILDDLFELSTAGSSTPRDSGPGATYRWALGQNSPNPVGAATEIRFEVAHTSDVSIRVYNAMGQLVRVLKHERMDPGRYSVAWDCTNQAGGHVSSGVYFYKMEAGQFSATRKMLVVK